MSKVVLNDLTSNFGSQALHNANNQTIEDELNNKVLYRNNPAGEPNQMENTIDMNSNKIINLTNGAEAQDAATVSQITTAIGASSSGIIASQVETQLGSQAVSNVFTFTGITYVQEANNLEVFREGLRLEKTIDYTETSTSSITLTGAPNPLDRYVFRTNTATTNSTTTTAAITHVEDLTTYNLATYLQNRHKVSASDFGAVFDGVTDDTAAIQAALDSGASVVELGEGATVVSSALTVPNFVSLIGQGTSTVSSLFGTTILYTGTGECINVTGASPAVPFIKNVIRDFRIRKNTQQSTRAAIAIIAASGVVVDNIRIDTDDNAYNFQYGVIVDECQLCTLINIDVTGSITEGIMTAGVLFTNGDVYTAGSPTNSTNTNIVRNLNINTMDYGLVHEGGEGFTFTGGNMNGCFQASMRLAGLNSFSIEQMYAENNNGAASGMQADVLIAQTTLLNGIASGTPISVGTGGGGTIKNCRMASISTNCIAFSNASIQTGGYSIFGNKFGAGRTGAAIATTLADGIRNSFIGPNVNLGGVSKNYLAASIYDNNTVTAGKDAQLEAGLSKFQGASRKNTVSVDRIATEPYVVTDDDDFIFASNNAALALNITLPTGADQIGREITVVQVVGTDDVIVGSVTLNAVGAKTTQVYDGTTWWPIA